ncbi:penicillin-binding protein 2 [Capnocytophaga cynodegmi]|uniref:Penicillin-binding protein 2 n=1 Tax=Capnocytophaga cynodegmi TaxID=28189 RepID=A0A0B7H8D1_9FLAO|nr:penicillin-binding protein 2 [Capnocytophaga cynodegmi]CEN34863.1 Penicillin-binding protein 2 [Capnocytophaga cynodegmi]CEN35881.1 Penicillin-binding protein 2 [Capnocytophaga cynodegmi]
MRKYLLFIIIILTSIIFVIRLVYLQVVEFNENSRPDEDVAVEVVYDYPERGYIYDRNGQLLVSNQPAYDVMVVPNDVKQLDTLELCGLLAISKEDFKERLQKAKKYSYRKPSVLVNQLSKDDYAVLQEKLRKFDGFYIQRRSLRHYLTRNAGNVLGYISEVNEWELKENSYYISGELVGRQGVEKQYESFLRGEKGVRYFQKDRHNRQISSYKEGMLDTLPVMGQSLQLTLDIGLQAYGEELMQNKRGGIVAIEPKTGEILALVSAPTFDPNLLVGRQRSKNYTTLYQDSIAKPLYDRALLAEYPPGSPFKVINALIALQENVISSSTSFGCGGGYRYGNRIMRCHCGRSSNDLLHGIAHSCNSYFANSYRRSIEKYGKPSVGMDAWSKHVKSFGLGSFLGSDFPTGRPGKIPNTALYDRQYGQGRWAATYNISNAIGQGEILTTPIQLANVMAIIANRGHFYTPHIVKKINDEVTPFKEFTTLKRTTIDKQHFEPIIQGMNTAYNSGTARGTRIEGIDIGAKTGTAENFVRINGKRMQLTDHSIFVAFAPIDDPKIAIAVFVENGYYGARVAGPIASLMIERYIKGEVYRCDLEKRMLEKSLEEEYAKPYSGQPFRINQ